MEVEQAAEVGDTTAPKLPDKVGDKAQVHDENLVNGNSNLQTKETHSDEDDGTGSDGFELVDMKENFDSAKEVEEERASPRTTTVNVLLTKQSPMEQGKTTALEEQMLRGNLGHSESPMLNQETKRFEELTRWIEELEFEKERLIKDMAEAENKQNLHYNSLQEAQRSLANKDKELADATLSLKELGSELESSKKRMQEMEAELVASADKLHKLEELKDERSLHAAQEAKRASELDKTLEMAWLNMKDMENQISALQEEIKGHQDKAIDHQQVEESLRSTISELKMVQEALELSKSQVADLEQKLASQDANISNLTEDLGLHCSSEESLKEKNLKLENELSSVHEGLQAKLLNLQEMESKLEEQAKEKQTREVTLEKQQEKILNLQAELDESKGENETLQGTIADLNSKLEEKESDLHQAEDEHAKAQLLLSEALSHKEELEVNLKSINEQHDESKAAAENANQKILEIEAQIQALHAAEEALKLQLEEAEARVEVAENKISDLGQQLRESENKLVASREEMKLLEERVQQEAVSSAEKERQLEEAENSAEAYKEKINELQSSLDSMTSKKQLLEQEIKDLSDKFSEHQEQAHSVHQRSLELVSLLHISKSDAEDAHTRTQDLEHELNTTNSKFKEAEADLEHYISKVSQLSDELEAYQTKAASLEVVMEAASGKEKELMESLGQITEEKKKLELLTVEYEEKLEERLKEKQSLEEKLQSQESKVLALEESLVKLREEKESHENTIADINLQLSNKNDIYMQLESQLSQAGDDHSKTRSLLSETQLHKEELELNLKSLNDLHAESKTAAESALQRIEELETQVQELSAAEQSLKLHLTEFESKLASAEKKSMDLEQELKDATEACNNSRLKVDELSGELETYKEEKTSLEASLVETKQKEAELSEKLDQCNEEKEKLEELSKEATIKHLEAEKQVQTLQCELESKVLALEESLVKLREEKESHENTIADINLQLSNKNDMYMQLESQLSQAGDDHSKTRSLLSETQLHKEELELNLKSLNDLHTESKTAAESALQRIEELETQVQELSAAEQSLKLHLTEFESKLASAEKKSVDLEQELKDATEACDNSRLKVDELSGELEAYREEKTSLEASLVETKQKEAELSEKLDQCNEEKEKFEELSKEATIKHLEAEKQVQTLQGELESAHGKLKEVESDLEALGVRESSVLEKLKSAEEQLEHKGRALEHATSKKIDLESLYQSLLEDTEMKLQQAGENLTQKETECQQLSEKLKSVEEQAASYQAKATAATEEVESMKVELEAFEMEISTLETTIEELKTMASNADSKAEQALAENAMMSGTNQALKEELDAKLAMLHELQEQFNSTHNEKEEAVTKLVTHERTIEHLTEVHSRGLELHATAESRNTELEAQMREAHETIGKKDSELKNLNERMAALESEIESLTNVNEAMKEEINAKLVKVDELQEKLSSISLEKEETAEKLAVHEKSIEHLREEHSRGLELQSVAELRNAEIESELCEVLEIVAQKKGEVTDLKEKIVSLETENEKLVGINEALNEAMKQEIDAKLVKVDELQEKLSSISLEKEETAEKLAVHEKAMEHLRGEHSRVLELQSAAESRNAEIESQLCEVLETVAQKEDEVTDLKEKIVSLETLNEKLVGTNEALNEAMKQEINAQLVKVDELQEKLSSISLEKEETAEKLAVYEKSIEHLREEHSRVLELQSAAESRNAEIESQLGEVLETVAQKEAEVTYLKEKIASLETENEKLVGINEALNEAMKQEINAKLAKVDELQEKLSSISLEKEETAEKLVVHEKAIEHLREEHSRVLELQSAAESRNAEIESELCEVLETVAQKEAEVTDLKEKIVSLETLNEKLVGTNESLNEAMKQEINAQLVKVDELQEKLSSISLEKEETAEKLAVHEKAIEHLREDHSRVLELQSAAASRNAEIESQLCEVLETVAQKEAKVTDLKEKIVSLETENEKLVGINEALKGEVHAKVALFDELQERFSSTHAEKEEASEKLAVHERTITHLTEVHSRSLELHSAAESKNEEIEGQLREALEFIAQKEAEVTDLKEKIVSLETLNEKLVGTNEALNEAMKQEINAKLVKVDELQEKLSYISLEKEETAEKLAVHEKSIEHLREEHSRVLELQSASELRNAEIESELCEVLETVAQKEAKVTDLKEKIVSLETLNEKLVGINEALNEAMKQEIDAKLAKVDELQEKLSSISLEKEETAEKLAVHEKAIEHLREEHSWVLELQSATESRNAEIESQLCEVLETVAQKEAEVTDLKEKIVSLETENEKLVGINEALKGEVHAKVAMFDELQERFSSTHAEKEEAAEKLTVHERTITHLTEVHSRSLELHSAAESKNEDIEGQLREALEFIAQKEAEVKDLSKKLDALEIELGYYEEQTTEAAATEEIHKVKFDEAVHKIKILEEQLAATQDKVELFHTEKENLVIANSRLNEELEVHQNKLNELQLALAAAVAEKEGSSEEIHSLRKTLDGMIQRKEELESQVSYTFEEHEELKSKYQNTLEEKQMLNEKYETAKKELEEAIAKLEEQMNVDKSEKELHISKLERQITLSELKYMEEIQTIQVETTEKDEALTAKMHEHANLLHEKDVLEQQLLEVRKELNDSYHTIANQEEQVSLREIKWDAYKKYSEDQLEAEQQHVAELEVQVSTLKQQLQEAEIRYKHKVTEEREELALVNTELNKLTQKLSKSSEMEKKIQQLEQKLQLAYSKSEEQEKDAVESTSRDFNLDSSALPNKQQVRSQAPDTTPTNPTQQEMREPSGIMAFKFILGVALLSVLIGVFLGKRY